MQTSAENSEPQLLCPECDYDLSGSANSDRCPWCGWHIDVADLVAANVSRHTGTRFSIAAAALTVSIGTIVALMSLFVHGRQLGWRDGLAVVTVLVVALAHAGLAVIVMVTPRPWPMRTGEASNILRFIGWGSIAASLVAATPHLADKPSPLNARGIEVNGIMEFVMAAVFFSLPGVMLLVLRMVSFRDKGHSYWLTRKRGDELGPPFVLEVARTYAIEQISQSWDDKPRPTSPRIEEIIARTWETEVAMAQEDGRKLYNGRVGRLIRIEAGDRELHFTIGETSYRDFLGTNLFHAAQVGEIDPLLLADALGISALVVTHDGFLVLGCRSRKVFFHAEHLHTFGGMLEEPEPGAPATGGLPSDSTPDGYDIIKNLHRELEEELGITPPEITSTVITGLARDRAILQPELIFDVAVGLTRSELASRFAAGRDEEHTALEFVENDPEMILSFLRRPNKVTPVAQAALLLHGKHHWGAPWFERACLDLYGQLAPTS